MLWTANTAGHGGSSVRGPLYSRIAAATGIDFVVVIAAIGSIEHWKKLNVAGQIAVYGSTNLYATVAVLHGLAAVFLFWFAATLAGQIRRSGADSERLASAVNGSGAVIAGILAIGAGAMYAAHQTVSPDTAALATAIVDGPVLFFPAAVLVAAAGVAAIRAGGQGRLAGLHAWLSLPFAAALLAGAGLMLFKNY